MRSIISSLGKDTISIIPTPLLFSKITEQSDFALANNVYIDIGYMHTTVVFESRNEIFSFETFPFGTKMLLDMLLVEYPDKTYLEIENILCDDENMLFLKREKILYDFFHYVSDVLLALLSREKESMNIDNIFLSG
jgi:hypothetical protein